MADGWVEFFDVETDEAEELFACERFKPVDYGCGVFPLVKVAFFHDCAVDAVEDLFADFAYLGLRGIDESAGWFVCEVWLVILWLVICDLPSHRNTQRQQHGRNVHWTHRERLQN